MRNLIRKLTQKNEYVLTAIFLLLICIITIVNPAFLTLENAFDILRSAVFVGICSIGFLFVLLTNGVDISFTATASIAQYVMAKLLLANTQLPVAIILLIPMVIGALLGALNALLINKLKVPTIIVTIATLNAYYGALQSLAKGKILYNLPQWFLSFPRILLVQFTNKDGIVYGLSILVMIWAVIAVAGFIILRYTRLGRKLFAVGGNLVAANREGINVNRVRIFAHAFLGFLAGTASIFHGMITQRITPGALFGQEFNVLTAVVLGGASISGGAGSIFGTILGVLLVAVIKNGLTIMGVPAYWHQFFIGMTLIISVSATATRTKLAKRRVGGIKNEN
jgi:simple sugar transport system permease protein